MANAKRTDVNCTDGVRLQGHRASCPAMVRGGTEVAKVTSSGISTVAGVRRSGVVRRRPNERRQRTRARSHRCSRRD